MIIILLIIPQVKGKHVCSACNSAIEGRCVTALFKKFHPEHFVCSYCLAQLSQGRSKSLRLQCFYKGRFCPLNLGFHLLPLTFALNTPYYWQTNLAEYQMDFWPKMWSKVHRISAYLVKTWPQKKCHWCNVWGQNKETLIKRKKSAYKT